MPATISWAMRGQSLFVIMLMVIALSLLVLSVVGHNLYWSLCTVLLLLVAVGMGGAFGDRG